MTESHSSRPSAVNHPPLCHSHLWLINQFKFIHRNTFDRIRVDVKLLYGAELWKVCTNLHSVFVYACVFVTPGGVNEGDSSGAARRPVHAAPQIQHGSSVWATGRASQRSQRSAERVGWNHRLYPEQMVPDAATSSIRSSDLTGRHRANRVV